MSNIILNYTLQIVFFWSILKGKVFWGPPIIRCDSNPDKVPALRVDVSVTL